MFKRAHRSVVFYILPKF